MIALATSWPEAAVAIAATCLQAWLAYLTYQQSRRNGAKIEESTIVTRSTDTTPEQQAGALHRREGDE